MSEPRATLAQMWQAAERQWSRLDVLADVRPLSATEDADRTAFLGIMRILNLTHDDKAIMDRLKGAAQRAELKGADAAVDVPNGWRA